MLRGCVIYDTEHHIGYPPLSDFVYIDKVHRPIPLRTARKPLLRAVFGDLTETILDFETEKLTEKPTDQSTISWSELQPLLNDHHIDTSMLEPLINDARGIPSKEVIETAPNLWTQVRH